jgi:hypothetical protein
MDLGDEAERAEAAADLLRGPAADRARELMALLSSERMQRIDPRGLWNLLWLAGELSTLVDVYCACQLLGAVEQLLAGRLRGADGEMADTAEMAFDFFFNREPGESPLASARLDVTLHALARLLTVDGAVCRRAALHGLGHLRQQLEGPPRDRIDALIDGFLRETDSTQLAQYAVRARAGELM